MEPYSFRLNRVQILNISKFYIMIKNKLFESEFLIPFEITDSIEKNNKPIFLKKQKRIFQKMAQQNKDPIRIWIIQMKNQKKKSIRTSRHIIEISVRSIIFPFGRVCKLKKNFQHCGISGNYSFKTIDKSIVY